jgi:hypothetical protein
MMPPGVDAAGAQAAAAPPVEYAVTGLRDLMKILP